MGPPRSVPPPGLSHHVTLRLWRLLGPPWDCSRRSPGDPRRSQTLSDAFKALPGAGARPPSAPERSPGAPRRSQMLSGAPQALPGAGARSPSAPGRSPGVPGECSWGLLGNAPGAPQWLPGTPRRYLMPSRRSQALERGPQALQSAPQALPGAPRCSQALPRRSHALERAPQALQSAPQAFLGDCSRRSPGAPRHSQAFVQACARDARGRQTRPLALPFPPVHQSASQPGKRKHERACMFLAAILLAFWRRSPDESQVLDTQPEQAKKNAGAPACSWQRSCLRPGGARRMTPMHATAS